VDFLAGLNPQQKEAVSHVDGPLLLLAGAGSGKTRVITHRMAHLVSAHRVPGPMLLAVTFTNKAAGEMRDRVQALLGDTSTKASPVVSTFHSFCVRLLRRDGGRLAEVRPGFTTRFNIYDDDDQLAVVKSIFRNLGLDEKQFMQYRAALSRISHAKNHGHTAADIAKEPDPKAMRLAKIFDDYEGRLRQANALDFDDLLLETVRLLRHDADTRGHYNRRFAFVMIDEYQDTNRTQYELMRLLTQSHSNICVVGDEDQSIYGWRGADIRNILDFERDFPNTKVIRLEQNYRSTKNILEAASVVIANNKERKGKWLWTEHGTGDKVGFYEAGDSENEALFIADTIEQYLREFPGDRVAVLYRTNFQSRQIEEALRRYNRKYLVVGGFSFYQRAEVKDVLAYLKAILNPDDSIALLRIINTPARGIGKTTIEQVERYALENNISMWAALDRMLEQHMLGSRAEAAIAVFMRMIDELREGRESKAVDQLMKDVVERTGYARMLEEDQTPESESRAGNIAELVNAAADAAERGETVEDFIDHAALVSDADGLDEHAQVSLLTMHNAKGLEFPLVFIAGMEEGLFPHSRSIQGDASSLEEERRLFYVGMTRAEKRLYLTSAKFRRRYGGGSPEQSIPSRFLKEVPRELLEFLNEDEDMGEVNLYAERSEVRDTVRKNLYTGKTYNSLDNIAQFFSERGMTPPRGLSGAPARPAAQVSPKYPPPQQPTRPAPSNVRPPVSSRKKFGPGSMVRHPKYGRGTVLRREGEGDDAKLTVNFPGYGLKKLIQRFAGITEE
jgi:DNA helicase-2/ATP-dependent DNA helicase PcrA